MLIDVVTLFPSMFPGILGDGIQRIAQEKGKVDVRVHNLRDFSADKHKKVDAPPYGGGAGMLIQPEPVFHAVEFLRTNGRESSELILLTPSGRKLDQALAESLARKPGLILLCGRYEGFDERVIEALRPTEVSVGDYVLSGGEIPAMVVLDAVVRLIPGVLGSPKSLSDESFSGGRLEYPQYTRPPEVRGMRVPEVLLSGDHESIRKWRGEQSENRTKIRRPDLADKLPL